MIQKFIKTKDKVKSMLIKSPHLRDDDNKLIANFYFHESEADLRTQTAIDFLFDFSIGKYTNPESIRRCRQKIQEENPELRGESWERKQNLGHETKRKINEVL